MILDIFENRDKTVWSLFKLADCLGRSLRENVALFYIDSDKSKVSYITESDHVITGDYDTKNSVSISNISITEANSFKEDEGFGSLLSNQVHEFVGSLASNSLEEASTDFDDILKLWKYRLKFSTVKNKLEEESQRFDETHSILKTEEVGRLTEVTPQIIAFLDENKEDFEAISEIANAVKLADSVAKAFDFPVLSLVTLHEQNYYELKPETTDTVFDMICKQELVKKELLESKKSFDVIWATNEKIKNLADLLYEPDVKVMEALSECLEEVPYMALVSKATLSKTFTNALSFNDAIVIPEKDIKAFASTIFEMKKPVRVELVRVLNENYGVNLQNLKETPSFRSLLNTQVVIFEALSKLSPKNSVQKQVLSEMSTMLKYKTGVESIDINDYLNRVFTSAGYLEEAAATKDKKKSKKEDAGVEKYMKPESFDMDKVSKDLKNIGGIFDMIKKNMQYSSEEGLEAEPEAPAPAPAMAAPAPAMADPAAAMAPPMPGQEGMAPGGVAAPPPMAPEQGVAGPQDDVDMLANLSELEAMVNDLAAELGMGGDPKKEGK